MEPTKAPRTDVDCWPFPCRDYHSTAAHLEGFDPCACECHAPANVERRDYRLADLDALTPRKDR